MAKNGGKNPMLGDEKAPSNDSLNPPSGNQNRHGNEVGYEGEGSFPLESKELTDKGPSDISGGH